jgi:hypothetical protein
LDANPDYIGSADSEADPGRPEVRTIHQKRKNYEINVQGTDDKLGQTVETFITIKEIVRVDIF